MCERFQETEHPYNLGNNHTIKSYNDKMGLKLKWDCNMGLKTVIYGV